MGDATVGAAWEGARDKVVAVDPKPTAGVLSWLIDILEAIVVRIVRGTFLKQNHYCLSGNHAPVLETPPVSDLPVRGFLPDCLNGEFVRIGPNPKFPPLAFYHWFDGDGMVHALRIQDGKATYVSRFVKTSRLKQEVFLGGAKFIKVGDLQGFFGLFTVILFMLRVKLKFLDLSYGQGPGNTNMIYHHGRLLALHEGDKPYVLKVLEDGDLQTVGLMDYDKRLQHAFTAHPKIDPFTGEMFTFGYDTRATPYCTYRVITKDGFMLDPVPITLSDPVLMHDFAITENFAIFMDLPLYLREKNMAKGGLLYKFDEAKKARFGLLPRYAKDELQMKWFELPNCYIFHNANAWEEEEEVVLITCRIENPDLEIVSKPDPIVRESFKNELYEMRFNVKTGEASQKKLSESAVDFPRINESYTGRKQRYVYGTIHDKVTKVKAIVKFDLHATPESGMTSIQVGGNVQAIYDLGPGRFGSEAVFVPKQTGVKSEEDDGYLIFFVHDENMGKSEVHVVDAKTMSMEPVAVVELPTRVPYGFHAFFVSEEQLKQQIV